MNGTPPPEADRRIHIDIDIDIDKETPQAHRALPRTAEAGRAAAAEAGLDRRPTGLVNLRVPQIDSCAYRLHVHARAAPRAGETTQRPGVLAARSAGATTAASDAAARERTYTTVRQALTDRQISAVIRGAITIDAFNRVPAMSGHPVRPEH